MKKSKLGAYLTLAPELLGLLTSAGTALAQDVKQEEILSQLEGKPPFVYPINEIPAPGDPYRIGKIQEAIQQEQEPIIAVDPEYAPEGSGNQARKEDKFVQFGAGFSACPIGPKREKLQYAKTSVMFPVLDLFEGDMQLLLELMGYSITNGYGKYFAGLGLEGRHYFAEKDSIVIPYFQLGAGVLLNDAYKE